MLELQVATTEQEGLPGIQDFQNWLDTCFAEADGDILVRVVDARESAELNQQYRHKEGPTNILSFPFEVPEEIENDHLGDLVMCAPVINAEALGQGKTLAHHWGHMLIHGVLHLQGYDHQTAVEAEEMERIEVDLLARLSIANPYA